MSASGFENISDRFVFENAPTYHLILEMDKACCEYDQLHALLAPLLRLFQVGILLQIC